MESPIRDLWIRALAAVVLAALALGLWPHAARAEPVRTGDEPWHRQASDEARQQAEELFARAVEKHQELLRGNAMELYEQALALWDNPDIRWNLSLVLEDLGHYLRAHRQLEGMLRWEAELGEERRRAVRDRILALETQRLARIETYLEEPEAEIKLDGQPWPRSGGRRGRLVLPGEHFIIATKPGYFPVTWSVSVKAGQQARVALLMGEDRLIETRRWKAWKPWAVAAAGVAVAAVGAGLQWQSSEHRDVAAAALSGGCMTEMCDSTSSGVYDRAVMERRLAIGAFAAGGTAVVTGLVMAWLNRPSQHRTEARGPSKIELKPILAPHRTGVSVLVRF